MELWFLFSKGAPNTIESGRSIFLLSKIIQGYRNQ